MVDICALRFGPMPDNAKSPSSWRTGALKAQRPARSILEAAGQCAAGLLTDGSASTGAFPLFDEQWLVWTWPEDSPITVAGPCRNFTGFPILLYARNNRTERHRTLFCFYSSR